MSTQRTDPDVIRQQVLAAQDIVSNPPPFNVGVRDRAWAISYAWALDVLARYGESVGMSGDQPQCPKCKSIGLVYSPTASYYACYVCGYGYEEREYAVFVQTDHTTFYEISDIRFTSDPDGNPTVIIDIR